MAMSEQAAKVEKGTLLTCGHEGCGCRVRVEEVCNCAGAGEYYVCICGAPLVRVSESVEA